MKRLQNYLLCLGLLAATGGASARAADPSDTPVPKVAAATTRMPRDWYPFRGEIAAVDSSAGKLHLRRKQGARVVRIEAGSEMLREGKPVRLEDLKIGEYVHGKIRKNENGEEVIRAAVVEIEPPAKGDLPRARSRATSTRESGGH